MSGNESLEAAPVKSFFVSMLTRDIDLSDAILDLLDNCVDGIIRQNIQTTQKPYAGFYANIKFSEEHFIIEDNCGGIPEKLLAHAFRMGRAEDDRDKDLPTIGTYGIGMKRAIFKMGRDCVVTSQNDKHRNVVTFTHSWMSDENNWRVPLERNPKKVKGTGTTIEIRKLLPGIVAEFGKNKEDFEADLARMIQTHYGVIIKKGFKVTVNNHLVSPQEFKLLYEDSKKDDPSQELIRPYIYKSVINKVSVYLAIGFTRPIPSQEELDSEKEKKSYSSENAGWTIACNDRVVLYCDKSRITGWGEAGVPQYHTQFIAISGMVEFRSDDTTLLPMTTTKRGIDTSSDLYLQVKDQMREGMKKFIQFTTRWKGQESRVKAMLNEARYITVSELKENEDALDWSNVSSQPDAKKYFSGLPLPKKTSTTSKITFRKSNREIKEVSNYLYDDPDHPPAQVGEKCFDIILKESKK